MQNSILNYNNGQLYYCVSGTGEPMIFIHGFSLDNTMWVAQIPHFEPSNKVVRYDMRGFGKSSLPVGNYSHHDDLRALMDELELPQAHLVGLSLGGEVAIDFALTYPTRVLSLSLLDSSLGGYKSTVDWNVHARESGIEKAKKKWLQHQVFASVKNKPLVSAMLEKLVNSYSGWHWLNADPRVKLDPPAMNRLAELKMKILTAVGEQDLDYYHNISTYIKTSCPNSAQAIIPNAGHMSNIENAEYVNALIENHIKN